MGEFANAFLDALDQQTVESLPPVAVEEARPGVLSQAVGYALTPLRWLGDAVESVDAPTRALISQVLGTQPQATGEPTIFGKAPTGREMLGLGQGTPGQFEWTDLLGAAAYGAASPLNLFGVGELTKGGEALRSLGKLTKETDALRSMLVSATGDAEKATLGARLAEQEAKAAKYAQIVKDAGLTGDYGKTWSEQFARGQRSGLSFNPIFSGINAPISPFGGAASSRLLGTPLDLAGRALNPFTSRLAQLFRLEGRIGDPAFDAVVNAAQPTKWEGSSTGAEEFFKTTKFLNEQDKAAALQSLADIRAGIEPLSEDAIGKSSKIKALQNRLDALTAGGGSPLQIARLKSMIDIEKMRLSPMSFTTTGDPRADLLRLGLERRDVPAQIGLKIDETKTLLDEANKAAEEAYQSVAAFDKVSVPVTEAPRAIPVIEAGPRWPSNIVQDARTGKSLAEMSLKELEDAYKLGKESDKTLYSDLFGKDAKRYRQLEQTANSTTVTHEAANAAQAEKELMEARLTPEQRDRLFGTGQHTGADWRDFNEFHNARQAGVESTLHDLANAGFRRLADLPKTMDASKWTRTEQLAVALFNEIHKNAVAHGIDLKKLSQELVGRASKLYDPSDLDFMLERFLSKNAPEASPTLKSLPGPNVAPIPAATPGVVTEGVTGMAPEALKLARRKAIIDYATKRAAANRIGAKLVEWSDKQKIAQGVLDRIPAEYLQKANRMGTVLDGRLRFESSSGVPISPLADPSLSYLSRKITTDGAELSRALLKAGADTPFTRFAKMFNPAGGFTMERVKAFDGIGIGQINDWARQTAKDFNIPFKGNFFEESPAEIMMGRLAASGKSVGNAQIIRAVSDLFSVPAELAKPGFIKVGDFLKRAGINDVSRETLKAAGVADKYLPNKIAWAALQQIRIFEQPEELRRITGPISQLTALARVGATIPFPAFIVRNVLGGNVFAMYMAGMRNPIQLVRDMLDGVRVVRNAEKALGKGAAATAAERADLETFRAASHLGAAGEPATLVGELGDIMRIDKPTGKIGAAVNKIAGTLPGKAATKYMHFMTNTNQMWENASKIALFNHSLRQGLTKSEAAEVVRKYLFNYGELSRFEKDVVRKWAFFYTWSRKSFGLMMERMFADPQQMRLALLASGQYQGSPQRQYLTPWQQANNPIYAGTTDEGKMRFLNMGTPLDTLNMFSPDGKTGMGAVSASIGKALGLAAPLVRAPIEMATGKSLTSGQAQTPWQALSNALPGSRFVSAGQRIGDVAAGKRSLLEAVSSHLIGPGYSEVDPIRATIIRQLDSIHRLQDALADNGVARRRTEYINQPGRKSPALQALNSEEAKLSKKLAALAGR